MKFSLKIITFIFCILFLFSCSEEDKVEKEKNYDSIVLNEENIEISNENFDKLHLIINVKDLSEKKCNSSKLNDFFNSLKIKFNKDNFSLRVKVKKSKTTTEEYDLYFEKSAQTDSLGHPDGICNWEKLVIE